MAEILDGKMLAKKIKDDLRKEVEELNKNGIFPKLAVIMVGNDSASKVYVRNKSIKWKREGAFEICCKRFITRRNSR